MLRAREYRSIDEARGHLSDHLGRKDVPNPFSRLEWFADLHKYCFDQSDIRVFSAIDGDIEAWIFLHSLKSRHLSALSNWYSFSWGPSFLGNPDAGAQLRLLSAIAALIRKSYVQIDLSPLKQDTTLLRSAFKNAGWWTVQRTFGGGYVLRLNGRNFATWWSERPGRLRNLVKRKGRNTNYVISISSLLTESLWQDFLSVQRHSWQGQEPNEAFLHAFAQKESAAGTLRIGFVHEAGKPVATQLWTVENGTAYIHKLAHNKEAEKHSPGTLLSHALFKQAIDHEKVSTIDYGTGDNPYKMDWMDIREPSWRIDCFNPLSVSSWLPATRATISALVG